MGQTPAACGPGTPGLSSLVLTQQKERDLFCPRVFLLPGGGDIKQRDLPEELSWTLGFEGCIGVGQARKETAFQAEGRVLRPESMWCDRQ